MRKLILLTMLMAAGAAQVFSCSTFLLHKNGDLVFGRNYDWLSDAGLVCVNLRGLSKTSAVKEGKKTSWVSRYGSITFNQYGKEFPTGGMNEEGLVVEVMWLDDSRYPQPDARPEMNVLQWIQYQLDNCRTVAEVISTDRAIRIAQDNPTVHFLVADATGNAATVEFLNGKMTVHTGKNLPVPALTNTDYATSIKKVRGLSEGNSSNREVFSDNSLQRFSTICSMVQQYNVGNIRETAVDYSFKILKKVANAEYTKWSIVYDIRNKAIHFKTSGVTSVRKVNFRHFDFSCASSSLSFDMNEAAKGDVSALFKPLRSETNSRILTRAARETSRHIRLNDDEVRYLVNYARNISCKNQQIVPRQQ